MVVESNRYKPAQPFTAYERIVATMLALLQFTIVLDFMVLSPLGAILMPDLKIGPSEFGLVVSAYAFSAGLSGMLAAGFADRFDRKRFLLFFYAGFVVGTLFCGLAPSYPYLLAARTITGLFGGVIGSIIYSIAADIFPAEKRGRAMGVIQSAMASSQIVGIPTALSLASRWDWHMPFLVLVGLSVGLGFLIILGLKPITTHMSHRPQGAALGYLFQTITKPRYLMAFLTTTLLATGGFMLVPFGSAYTVHNIGIPIENLPYMYLVTGVCTMASGLLAGKACDSLGYLKVFDAGTLLTIAMVITYTHLGPTPFPLVILVNVLLFAGISARMVSSQTLMAMVPSKENRGAFMSISSSVQQVAGGIAAVAAGMIVAKTADEKLLHFEVIGYAVAGASLVTMILNHAISRQLAATKTKLAEAS